MTAPILEWYDGDDLIEAPSAWIRRRRHVPRRHWCFDLWNDKVLAGCDTAYDRYARDQGSRPAHGGRDRARHPAPSLRGRGPRGGGRLLVRGSGPAGLGTLTYSETAHGRRWVRGAGLKIPTLASGAGCSIDLRVNTPGGPQSTSVEWALSIVKRTARPLPVGLHEAVGPGVNLGIGDTEITQLLYVIANVAENGGGVTSIVQMPDVSWVAAGVPYTVLEHLLDHLQRRLRRCRALIAGERYRGLIYAK